MGGDVVRPGVVCISDRSDLLVEGDVVVGGGDKRGGGESPLDASTD
jgi:hypothetical protein